MYNPQLKLTQTHWFKLSLTTVHQQHITKGNNITYSSSNNKEENTNPSLVLNSNINT